MKLMHCKEVVELDPDVIVRRFAKSKDGELSLAISNDFFDLDDILNESGDYYEYQGEVYSQFLAYYNAVKEVLNVQFNEGAIERTWEDDDYPDYAIGERVAIWVSSKKWLRIQHDDSELPIAVVLSNIN